MPNLALRFTQLFTLFACFAALPLVVGNASAEDVVLIEEHWELTVGGPDEARSAPQITMTMSPTSTLNCDFFVVTLNHWTDPDYAPGGIQLQLWSGEDCIEVTHGDNHDPLATDDEVISWIQRQTLSDGQLTFEVVDGTSQSWGSFGDGEDLSITHSTYLTRLNDYRPSISLEQSGIGYAGNRVSSLVLTRLRWVTADGEEHEMVAPIDIDTDLDP